MNSLCLTILLTAYMFKLFRQDVFDVNRNQNSLDNRTVIWSVFEFIFEAISAVISDIFKALLHH
jgi:hypothetical protein